MIKRSVAVIGSFKQHNTSVQRVCTALRSTEIEVTSPRGSTILEPGVDFVRYELDNPKWSDHAIQSQALHRIFSADLVYVVAPNGYVGNTTCYEVGRIIQRRQPIYFSNPPVDLPVRVPSEFVLDLEDLVKRVRDPSWGPVWIFERDMDHVSILERELIQGLLRND